jgi:hypothetical protein
VKSAPWKSRLGQLWDGQPTRIEWANDRLTFPTVPDPACDGANVSGSCISVAGLTGGSIRGQMSTLPTGEILRPELVILDDVQTRESAMSTSQSADRLAIIQGDVLGMGGPDRKISAIACVTVIRSGDLADVMLDRDRSPRWHGEKCRLLDSMPTDEKLWAEYERIRRASLKRGGAGEPATQYYREHQAEMDEGASAAWPARYLEDEVSAIQHGMNLKIDDEASFLAEYQNSPIRLDQSDNPALSAALVAGKTNGIVRGVLPIAAEHITAFIDVHDTLLYWSVCGWSPIFDGWVIDYGTFPEQKLRYFSLRKAVATLGMTYPNAGREGAIRAGLVELTNKLMSTEWRREDGAVMRIERCLIDCGYESGVVYDVCLHSPNAAVLMPSRGVGIGAAGKPVAEFDRHRGDRIGHFWWIPAVTDRRAQRHFRFDTNYWKTFVHRRLAVALGDPTSLSFFGHDPEEHRLIADHTTAEAPIRTAGRGRVCDEWRQFPDKPDNHFFDTVVGCAAAASLCGASLEGIPTNAPREKKPRMSMAALQQQKRAGV